MTLLRNLNCNLLNNDILLKLSRIKIYNINQFLSSSIDDICFKTKIPIKVLWYFYTF